MSKRVINSKRLKSKKNQLSKKSQILKVKSNSKPKKTKILSKKVKKQSKKRKSVKNQIYDGGFSFTNSSQSILTNTNNTIPEYYKYYKTIWIGDHTYQRKGINLNNPKTNIIYNKNSKRYFLEIELAEDNKAYFLLNKNDIEKIVKDENEGMREWVPEIETNMQIPTGGEGSCIEVEINKNIAYIKFIANKIECGISIKDTCKAVEKLLFIVLNLLDTLKFKGKVMLEDDMKKDGQRVMMYRMWKGNKNISKYEDYGFIPKGPKPLERVNKNPGETYNDFIKRLDPKIELSYVKYYEIMVLEDYKLLLKVLSETNMCSNIYNNNNSNNSNNNY